MYALAELPAGYALIRVIGEDTALEAIHKFKSTKEALEATASLVNGELSKPLKKFLKKNVDVGVAEQLAVLDSKLGKVIKTELGLPVVHGDDVLGIMRLVRANIASLMDDITPQQMHQTTLGLAHNMNRYKLRFSPDKIDMMIVQAISLLDDLDKELNKYAMRAKEWYGWHFPELAKILGDNIEYAKVALAMRTRDKAAETNFDGILSEETAARVREAAVVSMGTEVSDEDVDNICRLCTEVVTTHQYREQLSAYLSNRMKAIAPNLTTMVGEQIGARLIQKAGSLLTLAKFPASTVQILGAEKALFRALKNKQATPKYGILYNAALVTQAPAQHKGTMSRVLAAKTTLSARVDSFAEAESNPSAEYRDKVVARLDSFDKAVAYGRSGKARGSQGTPGGYNRDSAVKRSREEGGEGTPNPKRRF
jgi:nucleolar protein 58